MGLVEINFSFGKVNYKRIGSPKRTKTKTSAEQITYSLNQNPDRLISENELLKKENAYLQSEQDILKKVRRVFDNALVKSLWSRLKINLEISKGGYENLVILRTILFEFIEGYRAANRNNKLRLHSNLICEFLADFETQLFKKNSNKI